jgi:hypothetical protein
VTPDEIRTLLLTLLVVLVPFGLAVAALLYLEYRALRGHGATITCDPGGVEA